MNEQYNLPADTPPQIMALQASIVLQKPLLERLQMCADMAEFSLEMLKRHISAENPDMNDRELKFEIIKALYDDCFTNEEMDDIRQHFTKNSTE